MAIDIHRELVQVRAFRDWENKRAFESGRVGVIEFLLNGRDCDLVFDAGLDVYTIDFQCRKYIGPRRMRMRPRWRIWWKRTRQKWRIFNNDQSGAEGGCACQSQQCQAKQHKSFHAQLDDVAAKILLRKVGQRCAVKMSRCQLDPDIALR